MSQFSSRILFVLLFALAAVSTTGQDYAYLQRISGSNGNEAVSDLAVGRNGKTFLTGYGYSSSIGAANQLGWSSSGGFLLCVNDAGGSPQWVIPCGKSTDAVAIDDQGNVYFSGTFVSQVTVGSFTGSGAGIDNAFIAKVTPNGDLCWAKVIPAFQFNAVRANNLSILRNHLYLGGQYRGQFLFGNDTIGSATKNDFDLYLCQLDTSGNFNWIRNGGGTGRTEYLESILCQDNRVYFSGEYGDTLSIGGQTLGNYGTHGFIGAMDHQGNTIWIKDIPNNPNQNATTRYYDLESNSDTSIYFSGEIDGAAAVGELDSSAAIKWKTTASGGTALRSICIGNDQIYAIGDFTNAVSTIGSYTLIPQCSCTNNSRDYFMAAFDDTGKVMWAKYGGGEQFGDFGNAIGLDSKGNVIIGGVYATNAKFDNLTLGGTGGQQTEAFYGLVYTQDVRTRILNNRLCANEAYWTIESSILKNFDPGNVFYFTLSDSSGQFGNTAVSDTLYEFEAGTDTNMLHVPVPLKSSYHYSFRLISTSPVDTFYHKGAIRTYPFPISSFEVSDSVSCFKDHSIELEQTVDDPSFTHTYSWKLGDGQSQSTKNPFVHSYSDTGHYMVSLVTRSLNTCQDTAYKLIWIKPNPKARAFLVSDSACAYSTVTVNDSSEFSHLGGLSLWLDSRGQFIDSGTQALISLDSGWQQVVQIAIDSFGCVDSNAISLYGKSAPRLDSSYVSRNACLGDTSSIQLWTNSDSILWYKDGLLIETQSPYLAIGSAGHYSVILTKDNCTDSLGFNYFEFYSKPQKPTINKVQDSLYVADIYQNYLWFDAGIPLLADSSFWSKKSVPGNYYVRVSNNSNCFNWSDTIQITSSMIRNDLTDRFQVYPVPSTGKLQISGDLDGFRSFEILDLKGAIVEQGILTQNNLDLSHLPSGRYLLIIRSDAEWVGKSIQIQH